jgi:hypothetical protein
MFLMAVLVAASLAGCGWIAASGRPEVKPDAFVLRGHVTVPVAASDTRPNGAACAATVPGVVAGAPVRVTGPDGKLLGTGSLGNGVIARTSDGSSCDFPFQIAGVRGGVDSYDIAVADQPAQQFPAKDLRENAEAIVRING